MLHLSMRELLPRPKHPAASTSFPVSPRYSPLQRHRDRQSPKLPRDKCHAFEVFYLYPSKLLICFFLLFLNLTLSLLQSIGIQFSD
jgi:hypothetical protein